MKKLIMAFCSILLLSCNSSETKKQEPESQDAAFEIYKNYFVEELWKTYPEWASAVGYHAYDSVMTVNDESTRKKELLFLNSQLDSLKKYDENKLSANNKTDLELIRNQLHSGIFNLTEFNSHEWNPSIYNISGTCAEILASNVDKLDTRVNNIYLKLRNARAYYEAAKANIKNPTVEHTLLAIQQNEGAVSTFETDYIDSVKKSSFSESEKSAMIARSKEAAAAMHDYVAWLKALKNDTPRSFRLGEALYKKKFVYDLQSSYDADQMYEKASKRKAEIQQEMATISKKLWPKYMDKQPMPDNDLEITKLVIAKLSEQHTSPDSFQVAIENQFPQLLDFIKKKELIYIDPSKPLVVRKEPAYMQGVAGVSISAPGPYDKNGNTYYNVGSMAGYTKEAAESYLREYNRYILQILNIHEAIPGHYTQLIYSNQSPSLIKSLFGNNAMIEGWAVYTERMMMENGYDDSPEMWLMYYKWHLRSVCNTILDISVHTKEMKKEDAINFLVNEAFQQQAEAENKWRRVSVTQVQLCCYFTGYSEIYDFREELKSKQKEAFKLKEFHEKFLSYGSAPVKNIRSLMLSEMQLN
ncbi:MAG: DUF885 domain-containing protein [Bacteroidetes bacterium]|nr:DUF885 domain-containing protein [Bacteroidota bacterium]MBP6412356.1 DUF885 domain-containing protein [Bacteroidia bacterium]